MNTKLLTVACLLLTAGSVPAVTVGISNLGQVTSASTYAVGKSVPAFDFQSAVSFTTGAGAYDLQSVVLSFYSRNGAATGFTVGLYTGMGAGGPTGLVTSFTGNATPSTGLETYVPTAATQLQGNTTYWLVESAVSTPALTGFSLKGTNSLLEDAGGLTGWSIGDARWISNNAGASWFGASSTSGVLQFSVNASTASVPDGGVTAGLLAMALAALLVARGFALSPRPLAA